MKALVIGSGGREHAIAWKLSQSPESDGVFVAPGNGGTALESKLTNVDITPTDFDALVQFVRDNDIAFTVVGPEAPLAAGIVDYFNAQGLACFGPNKAAAKLESSKAFAKAFMQANNIPTGNYQTFNDPELAIGYCENHRFPLVIKADGLAAGKGVVIAENFETAEKVIYEMLGGRAHGDAGRTIVIEDFLEGEEASFMIMTDGNTIVPLATSQDHKARDDGDKGPNTGGMGAISPAAIVDEALSEHVMQSIVLPTIAGLRQRGITFTGFLYVGLMIDKHGQPKVLEYNCRLGDPETQPILMRLTSDFFQLMHAAANQQLDTAACEWDPRPAVAVVAANQGYPAAYPKGDVISGLDHPLPDTKVFHAGTALNDNGCCATGGRVLATCALGDSMAEAQTKAYDRLSHINWEHIYFRRDIGHRAIATERTTHA
jgi:phosphoribosylamine---glycine ligase